MAQQVYIDSDSQSTASTTGVDLITFTIPSGTKVRLTELALSPDSNFQSNGSFQLVIGGGVTPITKVSLPANLSFDFSKFENEFKLESGKIIKGLVLEPNDKVIIRAKASTGTVTLTATIVGEFVG